MLYKHTCYINIHINQASHTQIQEEDVVMQGERSGLIIYTWEIIMFKV